MKKVDEYSDEQLIKAQMKYGPVEMRPSPPEDASVAEALARRLLEKEKEKKNKK